MNHEISISSHAVQERKKLIAAMTCFAVFALVLALFSVPGELQAKAGSAPDASRGKELFEKRCGGCHSLETDKEGPRLRGVYGRKAGSVPSFQYSEGLKSANFTWDANTLDRWLTNTESVVPDNDMDFHVAKPDERADIIEFLRVSSHP